MEQIERRTFLPVVTAYPQVRGPGAGPAAPLAGSFDPDDVIARAMARYVLKIPRFVSDERDPRAALDAVFDPLERGLHGVS